MTRFPHLAATLAAHRLFANAPNDFEAWAELQRQGVNLDVVTPFAGPIVRTAADFSEAGWFSFDPFGRGAFAMAVHAADAETVTDLVAWPVRDPAIFGVMFGAGILGIDRLLNPASYVNGPCMLYSTPLSWLQAGCEGAAVLDYEAARLPLHAAPGPLTADSLAFADSLSIHGITPYRKLVVPEEWRIAA